MEEKECKWCEDAVSIRLSRWYTNVQYDIKIQFDNEAQYANFCPICGRALKPLDKSTNL